jgi:PHD/YefM family antitoxin component YafN of YafNO toxin-antitoxin module
MRSRKMPAIRKSADLRNNYGEISAFCHEYKEPVFITKNGQGDLAVMSIEAYAELVSRYALYDAIHLGLDQIHSGETIPVQKMMGKIKKYSGT